MNAYPDHGINDPDIDADMSLADGQRLPSAEAVLAATLALMTGHAQACCEERRWAMLTKTIANLDLVARHPGMSPGFKAVVAQLHGMWLQLLESRQEPAPQSPRTRSNQAKPPQRANKHPPQITQPRVLWHASPEILQ